MNFAAAADSVLRASVSAFGTAATYSPKAGGSSAIRGIFDNGFSAISFTGDISEIATSKPTLGIRLADLIAAPVQGDQVTLGTVTYRVVEIRNDGHGGSSLVLNKL